MAKDKAIEDAVLDEGSPFSFEINEEVESGEVGQGNIPEPGIHHNVTLNKVEYIKAEAGSKFDEALDFTFVVNATNYRRDNKGNILLDGEGKKVIISRKGDTITKREFFTESKMTPAKVENLMKRIKHIMVKFMDASDALVSGGNSFEALAKGVIAKLEGKTDDVQCKLKVVANGVYSNIPNYVPFLELQATSASILSISAKETTKDSPTSSSALADLDVDMDIPMD